MPQKYLSMDPNAGEPVQDATSTPRYLSTDPNAGTEPTADDTYDPGPESAPSPPDSWGHYFASAWSPEAFSSIKSPPSTEPGMLSNIWGAIKSGIGSAYKASGLEGEVSNAKNAISVLDAPLKPVRQWIHARSNDITDPNRVQGSQIGAAVRGGLAGTADMLADTTLNPIGLATAAFGGQALKGLKTVGGRAVRGLQKVLGEGAGAAEEALPALDRLGMSDAGREFSTVTRSSRPLPVSHLDFPEATTLGPITEADQLAGIEPARTMPRTPAGRLPGTLESVLFPKRVVAATGTVGAPEANQIAAGAERLDPGGAVPAGRLPGVLESVLFPKQAPESVAGRLTATQANEAASGAERLDRHPWGGSGQQLDLAPVDEAASAGNDATEAIRDEMSRRSTTRIAASIGHVARPEPPAGWVRPSETPSLDIVGDQPGTTVNASGAPGGGSAEEISRTAGMRARGEQFVTYDRNGTRRVIGNDPGAQDYAARPGETFGVEGPNGFQKLDDQGGRVPTPAQTPVSQVPPPSTAMRAIGMRPKAAVDASTEAAQAAAETAAPAPRSRVPAFLQAKPTVPADLLSEFNYRTRHEIGFSDENPDFGPWANRKMKAAVNPSPRDVWSRERKAVEEDNARYASHTDSSSESGFINPRAFSPEALDAAATNVSKHLSNYQYFSMLSNPISHIRNLFGGLESVGGHDLELALNRGLKKISGGRLGEITGDEGNYALGKVFSKDTLRAARDEYRYPTTQTDRFGSTEGWTGTMGRLMGSSDAAMVSALERAGVSPKLAQELLLHNVPKSRIGQWLLKAPKILTPFVKTSVNLAERGIERTPILGNIAQFATRNAKNQMRTSLAKQIIGGTLGVAGYEAGKAAGHKGLTDRQHGVMNNRTLQAALGVYALPFTLAGEYAANDAPGGAPKTTEDKMWAAAKAGLRLTPGIIDERSYDPTQITARLVPQGLDAINTLLGTPARSFKTSGTFTGPAVAKIPWLNKLLLKKKPRPAR